MANNEWRTLRFDAIEAFKRSWPCHGLPDNLHSISAEFAGNGDLVDIEAYGEDGALLDSAEFDGPALLALVEDCQRFGDISN
jgi:hypothetical protein